MKQDQLQFIMELEINKTFKYLELSIQIHGDELELNVYSNPTFRNKIILFSSCPPKEHNFAVPRYLISRFSTYQLKTATKMKEIIYNLNLLHHNSLPLQLIICKDKTKKYENRMESNENKKNRNAVPLQSLEKKQITLQNF
jgi:hypothetical protein